MRVQIRECVAPEDLDGLRRCVIELQDYERGLDASMPTGASVADRLLERMHSECEKNAGRIFVADCAGQVVGYCCVWGSFHSGDVEEAPRRYALVTDLVVLPEHRHNGTGAALIEAAECYARACGVRFIRVSVLGSNEAARGFYAARGFTAHEILLEKPLESSAGGACASAQGARG